ncbi:MAG: YibE/F family protein [Lactobacillus sp.]|uniref:YibE/F family protein n=1 Tax=Bombilactobacillus bombi TaxID=1303590 RepID=UPI0035EB18F5|nr:YibE/F family protein [Lactobacillus sp.]
MWVLTSILLLALILVVGKQGLKIFLSLVGGFVVLMLVIMLIADEFNPLIVGSVFAVGLVFLAIYPHTQNQQIRQSAIVSTLIVLVVILGMAIVAVRFSFSQGFSIEDTDEIEQFILPVGVSFPQIQVVVLLFSTLGAIAEASIAVSSGVWEIVAYQPQISKQQLLHAGQEIGRKNIATALNTLLFGFFGSYLTLGLWMIQLHYSLVKVMNNAILVSAILELLLGILGVIMVVFVTNYYIIWQRQQLNKLDK